MRSHFPLAVLLPVVLLALFAQAAHADALGFYQNWFITGDYAVAGVGLKNTGGQGTINMNNVPCTNGVGPTATVGACTSGTTPAYPIAAFLYWQTVENTKAEVGENGVFDGNAITGQLLGSDSSSACWVNAPSQALRAYRADVLRFLPVDPTTKLRLANYAHTVKLGSGVAGVLATEGASLVVIYRIAMPGNPLLVPLRSVVIYDGEFTMSDKQPSMTQTISGFYQASSTNPAATMTHIVGNGQVGFREQLKVNGNTPPAGTGNQPFQGAQGAHWDNLTFGFTLGTNASTITTSSTETGASDCLSWSAVVTSTNVQASANDGILDAWKLRGIHRNTQVSPATFGGCPDYPQDPCEDLHSMGATVGVKDIFIQMDWMHGYGDHTGGIDGTGKHSHIPQLAALTQVSNAFAANHIALHFDVGNNYQGLGLPYIIPYQTAGSHPELLARGGNDLDESTLLCTNTQAHTCDYQEPYPVLSFKFGLASVRDGNSLLTPPIPAHFAQDRKDAFHYVLFAHALGGPYDLTGKALNANPLSISGIGDRPGGDLMVTLGLWRSALPANDQVGSVLQQAGTLMHELGHNLDLSHGGWSSTPNCKPNYPSVMSYLYQTRGLTDVNGVEQIDYSHGLLLLLPLSESLLWTGPLGPLPYRMRYYGPLNATNSPGQAAQVHCDGTPITGGVSEIRLEGSGLFTPDWSNGTLTPLGKLFAFDANYDGIPGEILTDSPDWSSLNLAQVGSRVNFGSLSTGSTASDAGSTASDAGSTASDAGSTATDAGSTASDAGSTASDAGSTATDAGMDEDQTTHNLTSSDPIPTPQQCAGCGLTATSGANAITLAWTPANGLNPSYKIYRCAGAGCNPAVASAFLVPYTPTLASASAPTYADTVNDTVDGGGTCPSNKTCYNTVYTYSVTAIPSGGSESAYSNTTAPGNEVAHLFVIANNLGVNPLVVYGSPNPSPTNAFTVYGDVAGSAISNPAVSCTYAAPPRNVGTYPITCTGGTTNSATDLVSYNLPYNTLVGGVVTYITPGTLTISKRPITVTAASSKIYDANTTCPIPSCTAGPVVTWAGSGPALAYTDTPNFSESFDNKNVNVPVATHTVTPAGTVNDGGTPVGSNYSYNFVPIHTGTITPAALTITASTNTKYYDGTTSAAATPTNSVVCDGSTVTAPSALCGTDTVTNLTETYNSANAGNSVPITVSPGYVINDGNGGKNYTVSTNGTTGIINPAPVTVTAGTYTGTYNGAAQSPSACAVTPIAPNTFIGTVTCTNSPASVGPNAGSGMVTPVPAYGPDRASNYAVTPVTGNWIINPVTLTASIISNPTVPTKQYNGTPAATLASTNFSLSPLVGSENFTVTQTVGTYNSQNVATATTVTAGLAAGNFTALGATLAANYTLPTTASGPGRITPVALTASIIGNPTVPTKQYNGTTAATMASTNFSLTPLVGSESFTVTQTAGTYDSQNVATATTVTASLAAGNFTPGGATVPTNYTFPTTASGPGRITPVALTASIINNPTRAYNGTAAATLAPANFSLTPLVGSESFTVTQTVGTYNTQNVATATTVTASLAAGNFTSGATTLPTNYTFPTTASGAGTITPAPVTAAAGSYSGTYNGTAQTPSACAVAPISPNTYTGAVTCTNSPASVGPNAGSGTVTPVPAYGADSPSNYSVALGNGSWNILQATPTVTDGGPTPAAPDYGQPVTLTVTVAPPQSGETPTGTVTFSFTLNSITNYICSNGTISTSTPACTVPLTLSGSNYVASVTTSNLPTAAENVMATYSGDLNFQGETANNVSVTVTKANSAITLTKPIDPSTYGSAVSLMVNVVDATGSSIGVPTGTVTLSFQLDPTNHSQLYYICADGTLSTTPCASPNQIVLVPDPSNPVGAKATVPNIALPAGLASATPTFSYPINATYSGDTNFAPSGPFGLSQTVNRLTASVTPNANSKAYGTSDPSPLTTGTLTGFLPADGVTATYSRVAGEAPGSYTISATLSPIAVLGNYNIDYNTALFTIIPPPLNLLPAALAGGDQGVLYQPQQLVASGGAPPYAWSWAPAVSSALPPGLSLDPSAGIITGTPTAAGTYSFIVTVTDSLGTMASQTYSITVNLPPRITGATLPVATVGTPYTSAAIPVSNGTSPFNWSATGLPAGLSIAGGVISGTATGGSFAPRYDAPNWTATASNGGTITITPNCLANVNVTDAVGGIGSANFQIGSTPTSPCAAFGYNLVLGGGGVPESTWSFSDAAATTGTLTFNWQYVGFHAFFEVTALLQVFSGSNPNTNTITLYSAGPVDCCSSPSGGFNVQGTGTIAVTATQPFGFTVGGSNGDSNSVLNGTLYLSNFAIQ